MFQIVEENDLDGVDIDWEYPGMSGEDNIFRVEDKENFTLMFKAIREELDALSKKTGKKYTKAGVPSEKLVLGIPFYGVMFWQYASDPKGYLLSAINENR